MEGLEISIVNFKEVLDLETLRFDSDYFQKKYLQIDKEIEEKAEYFKSFSDFELSVDASAFYPSLEPYYGSGNIPFLRVKDVDTHIDYECCIRIPEEIAKSKSFKTLQIITAGDIVITKGGSIARIGLIEKDTAVTRDLIFINSSILPEQDYKFLFLYLLSSISYNQLIRSSSMTAQPHLTITLVRNLKLFSPSSNFKKIVVKTYEASIKLLDDSKKQYKKAENLLLESLGLIDFEPSKEPVNIKNFKESFVSSGRLDAEYYQKKYDDLEVKIKQNSNFKLISQIRTENFRGLQPVYVENGNLDVINSKHILDKTLDYGNFEKTSLDYWVKQKRARVFKEDILTYTTGANIGRTQVYNIENKALASNHVNIVRLKDGYNANYIGFVMNSQIGRMQTEQLSAGSAQAELYPKDIDNFLIPIIDETKQVEIMKFLNESDVLKKQSEKLLDLAKIALEKAIEENEEQAMKFIKDKTI